MSKRKSGRGPRRELPPGAPGVASQPKRAERRAAKARPAGDAAAADAEPRPRRGTAAPKAAAPPRPARQPQRAATAAAKRPAATFGSAPLELFVVCPPGIEEITAAELRALGVTVTGTESGGVAARGGVAEMQLANLHLRTANRVVVRVAEFKATAFYELEKRARQIAWDQWLGAEPVRLRVTCRKSKLYHSDAVAQRFVDAMARTTGARPVDGAAPVEEEGADAQLFVVRLLHDRCTVSVDSSGALLHRRGYRQATAKAPLRETLAAAMLLGAQWQGDVPLLDPLCGAGTIPIEGALLARRRAPGVNRGFAFMRWPSFERGEWERRVTDARERELPGVSVPITGSDRDDGAIEAALANAERAGVGADVELVRRSVSALQRTGDNGWLLTNPPYGVRVGEPGAVRDLYAQLGNAARRTLQGWRLGMLSPDRALDTQLGLRLTPVFESSNGGIPVRFVTGEVPQGS